MSRTLNQIRRGLCLKIAEDVRDYLWDTLSIHERHLDIDEIAERINTLLPLTYAETQEEEVERFSKNPPIQSQLPPLFDQLRLKLGLTKEHGAIEILKAAIERIP